MGASTPLSLQSDHLIVLDTLFACAQAQGDAHTVQEIAAAMKHRHDRPPMGPERVRRALAELVLLEYAARRRRRDRPLRYWWVRWP
jgi:hypothetical protein